MREADAILLAGDLARMDATVPLQTRLARLAAYYRQRAMEAEDRIAYGVNLMRNGLLDEADFELSRLIDGDPAFTRQQQP